MGITATPEQLPWTETSSTCLVLHSPTAERRPLSQRAYTSMIFTWEPTIFFILIYSKCLGFFFSLIIRILSIIITSNNNNSNNYNNNNNNKAGSNRFKSFQCSKILLVSFFRNIHFMEMNTPLFLLNLHYCLSNGTQLVSCSPYSFL